VGTKQDDANKPLRIRSAQSASPQMIRLMRIVRVIGIVLGGFVTVVGVMALVGTATDNLWVRLGVALVLSIALPAFIADRFLKRFGKSGGLALVGDVFAIVFLAIAIAFIAADGFTKKIFLNEGDRYARAGPRMMARAAYSLAGVSPVFPEDAAKANAVPAASSAPSAPSSEAK